LADSITVHQKSSVGRILALVVSGLVTMTAWNQGCAEPNPEKVDALFAQWNKTDSPGCGVAVSRNGTLLYEHGYGMARIESGVPITTETILGAASISKQFTAMSILLLANRGQLSLDDEVSKYVPGWVNRKSHVTIHQLLTHTSGLREGFSLLGLAQQNPWENQNEAIVRALARQKGVNFEPGAEWQYNNGGYNLLGSIVRRVSGQSLRDFEQVNIFTPLGMKNSQLRDSAKLLIPHIASGYTADETGVHPTTEAVGVVGNAGLYTTPRDLLLWEQNFETGRVGTPEILAAMQQPAILTNGRSTHYGFGLFISSYRGLQTIEHSGSDRGIASNVVRYPDQKLAIALICNTDAINPIVLTQKLSDLYLEDVLAVSPAKEGVAAGAGIALKESELARRVGTYRGNSPGELADLQVSMREGKLIGHSFYDDDVDFDLIPSDATHVHTPGGGQFEFVPPTASHPQEWIVTGDYGSLHGALQLAAPAAADLRPLAGDYRSSEIDASYDVILSGSGLVLRPPGSSEVPMRPIGRDTFAVSGMGVLQFLRNSRGEVGAFTINRYNLRGLRFDRFQPVI
jgi:CubicO group peptidase (beta-lactamase class C family)